MPLMRDPNTKAVIEVHPKWIARWPDDFEPVKVPKKRPSNESAATPTGADNTREGEDNQ